MADILFTCSGCSAHLAVGYAGVGAVFACTTCGQQVLVPTPSVSFECPKCRAELAAPFALVGESFDCPNCNAALTVPKSTTTCVMPAAQPPTLTFMCSGCARLLSIEMDCVGQVIECAECKQKVLVPEVGSTFQCSHCHAELSAPAGMVGEAINCPECDTKITVPPPSTEKPRLHLKHSTAATAGTGEKNKKPKAGKRVKCHKCHTLITFTQAQVEQALRVYKPYSCPKCDAGILLPGSPLPDRLCPYCGSEIATTAVLCINCGTNLHTGRRVDGSGSGFQGGNAEESDKRILPLFLFYLFLSSLGIHCFYAGRVGKGVFYLFGFIALIICHVSLGVWAAMDETGEGNAAVPVLVIVCGLLALAWGIGLFIDFFTILTGNFLDENGCRIVKWT